MKSGWIIFTLVIISITLTLVVTMMLVSEYGIENEGNIFARFTVEELGMWGFPVLNISAVLLVYFFLTMIRKFNVRVASSFLLTVLFLSISDMIHDIHVLVTGNPLFPLSSFFVLVPVLAILSLHLLSTNKVPPLKF